MVRGDDRSGTGTTSVADSKSFPASVADQPAPVGRLAHEIGARAKDSTHASVPATLRLGQLRQDSATTRESVPIRAPHRRRTT